MKKLKVTSPPKASYACYCKKYGDVELRVLSLKATSNVPTAAFGGLGILDVLQGASADSNRHDSHDRELVSTICSRATIAMVYYHLCVPLVQITTKRHFPAAIPTILHGMRC